MRNYLIITLIMLFVSCSAVPETYNVEDIDGVRYVHNNAPLWGDEQKIELEFVKEIGGVDEGDDNLAFFNVYCAMKDSDQNLYIMENGNKRIQKLDPIGKYILTIGSEGQGPGELGSPRMIDIDNDRGIIYIADAGNGLISIFDLDGKYKDSIRFESGQVVYTLRSLGGGELVTQMRSFIPGHSKRKLLTVFDEEGDYVHDFGEMLTHDNSRILNMINSVYFETDFEKNVFVTFRNENRIVKYSRDGELLWICDRPLNFEINHKLVKRTVKVGDREIETNLPDMTWTSGNICVDGKGRIWVSTYLAQAVLDDADEVIEESKITISIFDKEGIYLGNIPYPRDDFAFLKIQGDTVYFAGDEYTTVYEYHIVEKLAEN